MGIQPPHVPGPKPAQHSRSECRGLKILIADGDATASAALAATIRDIGHLPIGPAISGAEALQYCEAMTPDLAVLDLRLSGDDDQSAAATVTQRFKIPTIIVTACAEPECIEEGALAGAIGYLLKPVSADQIRAGINIAWTRGGDLAARDHEIAQLRQRLDDRKIIEQAKWLLVQRKSVAEPEAMRMLQRQARNLRRSLVDVARALIENDDLLSES